MQKRNHDIIRTNKFKKKTVRETQLTKKINPKTNANERNVRARRRRRRHDRDADHECSIRNAATDWARNVMKIMWCVACSPSPPPLPPPPSLNRLRYNIQVKMGTAHGSSGDGSGRNPREKKTKSYTHIPSLGRYIICIHAPVYTCV